MSKLPKIKYDPNKGWMADEPEPVKALPNRGRNISTKDGERFQTSTNEITGTSMSPVDMPLDGAHAGRWKR